MKIRHAVFYYGVGCAWSIMGGMPVRYGIVCDRCRKLHFALGRGKPGRVRYDKAREEFKVACVPPCTNIIYFTKSRLTPYVVPDEALGRGYAEINECRRLVGRS